MENDNEENLIDLNNYFKLDFSEQKLEGNRKFEEFKKQQLIKLGKDAKLFQCKTDNIYFYVSKKNCKIIPYYFKKCPLCNKYACYFCKRNFVEERKNTFCCKKLSLYNLFFNYGFFYLKDMNQLNTKTNCDFIGILILDLITLFSWFFYSMIFFSSLFFSSILKEQMWKHQSEPYSNYAEYFNKSNNGLFFGIIIFGYSFALSICYTIINIYLKIILLIISLFTKFYPYKYYVGIITLFNKS